MAVPLVAAAAAFNLVCSGVSIMDDVKGMHTDHGPQSPFAIVYRVDLAAGRWCSGECATTSPLYSVTDTAIVFEASETPNLVDHIVMVQRESGDLTWRDRVDITGPVMTVFRHEGKCHREAFGGFPVRMF